MAEQQLPFIDSLWDYNDPAGTQVKFKELELQAKQLDSPGYHLEIQTQIARTHSLQREFDQAHALLDSVEATLSEKHVVPTIRYLLERGRTFNSSGDKEKATELFIQARDLSVEHGEEFYAVDAVHMLAISDKPDKQLDWNLEALRMSEASGDPRAKKWIGSLYNNIGWTYHDQEKFDSAMMYFQKAFEFQKAQGDLVRTFVARWAVARTHRSLGQVDEALSIQQSLLAEIERGEASSDGYVYEEIGECLLLKGDPETARPYFAKAYDLLSSDKWMVANEAERLKRLRELATAN